MTRDNYGQPAEAIVARRHGPAPGPPQRVVSTRIYASEAFRLIALAQSAGIRVNRYLADLIRAHFQDLDG